MEANVFEVLLSHSQYVAGVGEKDVTVVTVFGHVLILALLEFFELGFVARFYLNPTGLVERNGLPAALCVVFVLEAVLNDLKLKLTYRADNLAAIELIGEELGYAFVHKLVDTFLQLFGLHRVSVFNVFEHLGREAGETTEMHNFAFRQRVAYLVCAVVGQTYYVAGPSFVDSLFALRHELCGRRNTKRFSAADMEIRSVADELARAYLTEGDTGAVVGVDVGRDLEDEAGELLFLRVNVTLFGLGGAG